MNLQKLTAGAAFPLISVPRLGGGKVILGQPTAPHDWQLIIVYRGKHCPMCTRFLTELNEALTAFNDLGVDVVAVSADPQNKAQDQMGPLNVGYHVGYDLSLEQMQKLGVYISNPRSPEENDRPFAEPGAFVVNDTGKLQLVDLSNAPFLRPHIPTLVSGVGYIRNPENNYPIRGTFQTSAQ